ncbi:hypothetical protein OC846_001274 [Tilletia horrida]|uniref:6-phosphogluconate dehydrogenase NADP-binding domain-containing protein n=1 Tax=Tilletia horrida TaxID=155126 RepID=A0AAN6JTP8_9BASI|nr:hypothetical protein OC845_000749 [Tilletia horrida]KAK0556319.1 hypothetical protein OC846_001274 [Tilletia horrida]KAK0569424.1 hypothetical protein OC861_000912 [Tilletia horrida]
MTFSQVAWAGLGNMGGPMAANMAKHLHSQKAPALLTWNRTTSKISELAAKLPDPEAIREAASLEEIGEKSDLIFTSVANDSAARSVIESILTGIKKHSGSKRVVIVETSTISAATAQELSQQASAVEGVSYVQAPAFGPPPMAVEAKLVLVLAGPKVARDAIESYIVPAIGRKTINLSDDVRQSSLFKLVGNGFIAGLIELLAECATLANTSGVGDEAFLDFIKDFVPAPSAIGYGTKMVKSTFDAQPSGFAIDGGLKDVGHILDLAKETGATMPILEVAKRHLEQVRSSEEGAGAKLDWSALVAAQREESGLPKWKDSKKP